MYNHLSTSTPSIYAIYAVFYLANINPSKGFSIFVFLSLFFFFVKVVIRINMLAKSTTTWLSIVIVYSKADAISSLLVNHYNESG